jgi:uncharacterized protein
MFLRSFYIVALVITSFVGYAQNEKFKKLIPEEPIGWTSDFEKLFTEDEIKFLDSIIGDLSNRTSNQIAIVTLVRDSTQIRSIEELAEFSLELLNKWGVGVKGKDNGIGIIFSKNLRRIWIEVGPGLRPKLTGEKLQAIIDDIIIPEFKKSSYFNGTVNGLMAIIKEIE